MTHVILSTVAAAAIATIGASANPSVGAESLTKSQDPTACDCTNCSAQHCRPHTPVQSISLTYQKVEWTDSNDSDPGITYKGQ